MMSKSLAPANQAQSMVRVVFSTGVLLLIGATIMFAYEGSRDTPRPAGEYNASRPLTSVLPQAYDDWRRTDFVGREAALAAIGRVSEGAGLSPLAAQEIPADDVALALYSGDRNAFAILLARGAPDADWEMPSGPVRVVNGRLFEERQTGASGIADLTLRTRSGLTVMIRGRARPDVIEDFVMRMGNLKGV